jgi:hypothetical protein
MPFPGTKVIPTGWSSYHQPVAKGGMNATVTVGNTESAPQYNAEEDDYTTTWSKEYDQGPARVQELNDSRQADAAGQLVTGRTYLVQLDANHSGADVIKPGARVLVTAAVNDAQLVGQELWVVDVQLGSERFTRDLVCSDNETDTPSTEEA